MMDSFSVGMDDDTLDAINQILPQIQNQIKEAILQEEQGKMKLVLQQTLAEIQKQAEDQFHEALIDLEEESQKLKEQQTKSLRRQIEKMRMENDEKERTHRIQLQEKLIGQNFNQRILNHEKIQQLEQVVMEQICLSYQQKFEDTKNRKIKEMLVKLQNKEQKQRKEKDKYIRNKVYGSMGIEELKRDIQLLKVGIASMKSQFNIKMKKIEKQIKEGKEKNNNLQRKKENLTQLKIKLLQLKEERQRQSNPPQYRQESDSKGLSYLQSFSLPHDPQNIQDRYENIHEKNMMIMESSDEEDYEQDYSSDESQIQDPPKYEPQYQYEDSEDRIQLKNPILGFNIGALLRQDWEMDPLQKYISNSTKQNDSHLSNKNTPSNFQQKYHEQLKKMNGKRKLSQKSKNQIIKNLAMRKKKVY